MVVCVVKPVTVVTVSASTCHQCRRHPVHRSPAHCVSRGAWKRRVPWTRTTWCARSDAFWMTITVTMSSVNDSYCYAHTPAMQVQETPSSSGKWKSVSCLGCHWMAYVSSASLEHQLGLKTLHQKLPMNYSCKRALHRSIACHVVISNMQEVMVSISHLGWSSFRLTRGTMFVLRCRVSLSFSRFWLQSLLFIQLYVVS